MLAPVAGRPFTGFGSTGIPVGSQLVAVSTGEVTLLAPPAVTIVTVGATAKPEVASRATTVKMIGLLPRAGSGAAVAVTAGAVVSTMKEPVSVPTLPATSCAEARIVASPSKPSKTV